MTTFCHFFMQNFSFLRGWVLFLSKQRQIFEMKLHVFAGLGALFGTFFINFLSFFLNVPPISPTTPEGERAKRARLTRDADSRCTLAGGPGNKNLVKLGVENINFKIPYCRTVFIFSCKTSAFFHLFLIKKLVSPIKNKNNFAFCSELIGARFE